MRSAGPAANGAWAASIPEERWAVYDAVIAEAQARGVPFGLGGAFGYASYTGMVRDTKDMDFFVTPRHRDAMIAVFTAAGAEDYFAREPYDRAWIYRAHRDDTIVDLIWAMANRRAEVDERWLEGPRVTARGRQVTLIRPEELLWQKLYVMQRDRCDWPDVLNMLYAVGGQLDWEHLLDRLQADWPVLAGALWLYRWLCPGRIGRLPPWVRERFGLPEGEACPREIERIRADFLDRRQWFHPQREEEDR